MSGNWKVSLETIQLDVNKSKELNLKMNLKAELGIFDIYDDYVIDEGLFLKHCKTYKSLNDYLMDRYKAIDCIDLGIEVPSEIRNRLIKTKEELEAAGVEHKY